jgi:hypothetical protein
VKDSLELDFIVDSLAEEPEYPIAQLTGWEAIVFELQEEEEEPQPAGGG